MAAHVAPDPLRMHYTSERLYGDAGWSSCGRNMHRSHLTTNVRAVTCRACWETVPFRTAHRALLEETYTDG